MCYYIIIAKLILICFQGEDTDKDNDTSTILLHQHSNGSAVPLSIEKTKTYRCEDQRPAPSDGGSSDSSSLLPSRPGKRDVSPDPCHPWSVLPSDRDQLHKKEDDVRIERVRDGSRTMQAEELKKRPRHELENDVRIRPAWLGDAPQPVESDQQESSDATKCSTQELSRLGFADPFWSSDNGVTPSSQGLLDGSNDTNVHLNHNNNNKHKNNNNGGGNKKELECNGLPSLSNSCDVVGVRVSGEPRTASVS